MLLFLVVVQRLLDILVVLRYGIFCKMLLIRVLVVSSFSWVTSLYGVLPISCVRGCPIVPRFEHVRAGGGGGGSYGTQ